METCSEVSMPHQSQLYLTSCELNQDNEAFPYSELVGTLNYVATPTRPDISYIVNNLCRFISKPAKEHWEVAKRVLRYLKQPKQRELYFQLQMILWVIQIVILQETRNEDDRQVGWFSLSQVVRLFGKVNLIVNCAFFP